MSTLGGVLPIRKLFFWIVATCLPVAGLISWWLLSFDDGRGAADASLSIKLPPRPGETTGSARRVDLTQGDGQAVDGSLANPAFTQPALDPLKPIAPDLALVDASPLGPLPRIGSDGRRPALAYARPYDRSDDRPKVAIMMMGLGPQADATNAALHLPGPISLMFSPYAEDLPSLFERARLAGHEVLLELPMEPEDYPASDPGPHTLRASGTADANIERLLWVLARAPGYFAVAGRGGAFGASPEARPVIDAIAAKGVGMIEIGGDALAEPSQSAGLAYASTPFWIDAAPTAEAIDEALAKLEAEAKANGDALGVAEPYPITLQRLVEWAADLEDRGVVLAPVSAVLEERNIASNVDSQASNLAQSRN
jgi:polysaccharide deacetylase 2 family uncharacterized protein YibQ